MSDDSSVVAALVAGGASVDEGGSLASGLTLRLRWYDVVAVVQARAVAQEIDFLHFNGQLPPGLGRAHLTHQSSVSAIAQLKEQKLGIKAADDAFIVYVDDDGFAVLSRCGDELRALVPDGTCHSKVEIHLEENALRVLWPVRGAGALPALWEKLVNIRNGG